MEADLSLGPQKVQQSLRTTSLTVEDWTSQLWSLFWVIWLREVDTALWKQNAKHKRIKWRFTFTMLPSPLSPYFHHWVYSTCIVQWKVYFFPPPWGIWLPPKDMEDFLVRSSRIVTKVDNSHPPIKSLQIGFVHTVSIWADVQILTYI